jgi:hypothetical protein
LSELAPCWRLSALQKTSFSVSLFALGKIEEKSLPYSFQSATPLVRG